MKEQIQNAVKEALKAKDKVKLDTLRLVLSAIQYEEMEKKVDQLAPDQIISILQREIKRRREEIDFADKANRPDLKESFIKEIAIIEAYLPKQLSAQELEKLVGDLKAQSPGINMGTVMKSLKEKYAGQYDSKLASDLVKKILG